MKNLKIILIFVVFTFAIGIISFAEAHQHATVELTSSHSHILADEKFHDNFLIHTFDQVIFSVIDFFNDLFFR